MKKLKITYRQEDGDDGYCYVLRIDGRMHLNGLTRREAIAEKEHILTKLAFKELKDVY